MKSLEHRLLFFSFFILSALSLHLNKQALVLLTTYRRGDNFLFYFRKVGHAYDEGFHTSVPMMKLSLILTPFWASL